MKLVRYETPHTTLFSNFNRFFDEAFQNLWQEPVAHTHLYNPAVDVYEDEDHLYLKAELPGFTKEQIDLQIEKSVLTIKAERKASDEEAEVSYSRSFTLDDSIDTDNISAELKNGVLTLTLPRKEESKPRQIQIQ
jgi:HSP20 family protein